MDKSKLLNFIGKYNLNGICNTVKWTAKNRGLITNFISDDKSTLGMVGIKGINFPEGKYGIYNTKSLMKILGALQNEFEVAVGEKEECLDFKDESLSAKFMLAKLDIIEDPPPTQDIPDADFDIDINSIFIDKFIKSKGALDEASSFAFATEDDKVVLIINYAQHNTDRITIKTEVEHEIETPLLFNADIFKEVLLANKDCTSGKISVSAQGIMICQFEGEDIKSKYYLVMLEQ